MPRFGVLGSGVVAQMLANGLERHGYDVRIGSREPAKLAAFHEQTGIATGTFAEVAEAADVIVLAVKGLAAAEALQLAGAGSLAGKVVIDATLSRAALDACLQTDRSHLIERSGE
jgi:predicted dinucleotide-binding enzyme